MKWDKAFIVAAMWAAPAVGIWLTGESNVGWAWCLSYWATINLE